MNILEIIEAKKRGRELTEEQIRFAVDGFTADTLPTSTAPAGWGTRSACCWRPWRRSAA